MSGVKWSNDKKNKVFNKCNKRCFYCGEKLSLNIDKKNHLKIDHIIPKKENGKNDIENLNPSCVSCNASKGSKSLKEYKSYAKLKHFNIPKFTKDQIEFLKTEGINFNKILKKYKFKFYGEENGKKSIH